MNQREIIILGLNHKSAPVDVREKLAFEEDHLSKDLDALISETSLEEGMILSTCNRVEIYGVTKQCEDIFSELKRFIAHNKDVENHFLENITYGLKREEAIVHGFRVAASLDSMVLGENQITGQVKKAYQCALDNKSSGIYLNRFMHKAFNVAKMVKNETGISQYAVSIGSVAVDLAKNIFGHLNEKKVAVFGMGEIGQLVLDHIQANGVEHVSLINRTFEKALVLQERGLGVAHPIEEMDQILLDHDVLIMSLGVKEVFLDKEKLENVMKLRKYKPIFIIDLGVPRNVDALANQLSNVYLYNVDDLNKVAQQNQKKRKNEAQLAEMIVKKEASQFYQSMLSQKPMIGLLSRKFDEIRRQEVVKTLKRLEHLSDEEKQSIEKLSESIVGKILHDPILTLRSEDIEETHWNPDQLLRKLFKLGEE